MVTTDDGVELWTLLSGTGPPMILCHGGPGHGDNLGPVAGMVDDLATVLRWDQRGGGRSTPRGPYDVDRFVADIEALRDAHAWHRIVIGGHSWGAALALRYALAHPERAAGLVYIAGTDLGWVRHRERYHSERLRRMGPRAQRWQELRALPTRTPEQDREMIVLASTADFADADRALELATAWDDPPIEVNDETGVLGAELKAEDLDALAARCRTLTAPALVVHGDHDIHPVDGPRDLAETLPAAELVVLEEVGHIPWAENPHRLRAALRAFLRRIDGT